MLIHACIGIANYKRQPIANERHCYGASYKFSGDTTYLLWCWDGIHLLGLRLNTTVCYYNIIDCNVTDALFKHYNALTY